MTKAEQEVEAYFARAGEIMRNGKIERTAQDMNAVSIVLAIMIADRAFERGNNSSDIAEGVLHALNVITASAEKRARDNERAGQ